MRALRLILGDQLTHTISTLKDINPKQDVVLMCEVMEEATYVTHHPKKIAFIFSAMRHFSEELGERGISVRYVKLDDEENTGSFNNEVKRAVQDLKPETLIVTEPGEYRVLKMMQSWQQAHGIPVEILADTRFLALRKEFAAWAKDKKQLRMEFFYRAMRKKYHILITADGGPVGGQWNYDKQNRKPPKSGVILPKRISHPQSLITQEVIALVLNRFSHHFGKLEPFHYAVTRREALVELDHFIEESLTHFGDYQDAMLAGEFYLYHSLLSSYLNVGLLLPLEVCQKVEAAYQIGKAPLNAVEGFIRQVLGWREYIRGVYWHFMPEYSQLNALNATRPLPNFYWTAKTNMACMAEAIRHTHDHAYSHHIQRLMVTGNFALIAGLDVIEVQQWYLAVYSDAYEWVEMPNTLGMALFGDGGVVASKPYAASGKYIHRMSNYCEKCIYDPEAMTGKNACPFNALYWDFLMRHEKLFRGKQRMYYIYSTWDKFSTEKQLAIRTQAQEHLYQMREGNL